MLSPPPDKPGSQRLCPSQEATRTTPAGGGQLSPHPSPPWGVLGPGKQEEDTALSKVLTQVLAVPAPGKRLQQALWG